MANDVRRDLGRIGRDVGRIGRCVGRSSGCRFLVWLGRSKSMGGRSLSVNLHVINRKPCSLAKATYSSLLLILF